MNNLFEDKVGIELDIGCGANKRIETAVGMDVRELPGVDIVHDIMLFPWPVPNETCNRLYASHLCEHIPPFGTDPKLIQLVSLLVHREILTSEEANVWLGDWENGTPGFIRFMDEAWRVAKVGAQFAIAVPHALSGGFPQDPTHINMINENTFRYFDPFEPVTRGMLYNIYQPKPWELVYIHFDPSGSVEVILRKRSLEELEVDSD